MYFGYKAIAASNSAKLHMLSGSWERMKTLFLDIDGVLHPDGTATVSWKLHSGVNNVDNLNQFISLAVKHNVVAPYNHFS